MITAATDRRTAPWKREAIRAAHANGATTAELADMFNCTRQSILKHLEKLEVKPNLPARLDPVTRLMGHVEKVDNGCWMWTSGRGSKGYRYASLNGKSVPAHVAMFILFKGQVPDGNVVDHQCHNRDSSCPGGEDCPHRRCVNPDHLEAVTAEENTRRGFARITHCKRNHEFTPENTKVHAADGRRRCRTCEQDAVLKWRQNGPSRHVKVPQQRQPVRTREEIKAEQIAAKAAEIECILVTLDAVGIPREWGWRRAKSAGQHLGITASKRNWEEAIRRRKELVS